MARPKCLLLGSVDFGPAQEEYKKLRELADLVETKATNRNEFLEECKKGTFDGVKAIYRTFASAKVTGRFDEEVIKALPNTLKFVCHCGAGYDNIDIEPCTARGIHVSNVPTAVDDATADTAVFLILGALRNFNGSMMALRRGEWRGNPPEPFAHDPEGKVLGILGYGGIGRNLARKMKAFGMRVQYYSRNRLDEKEEDGANYVSFEDLLKTSDVLSLNLPLNAKTRHIIGKKELSLMKSSAVLVNTARGGVIDEAALVEALDNNVIASVGLDVFEEEPKIHPGLMKNEKVTLLPHMGTWTFETQTAMELWNISNIRMALETGRLKSPVPEQKSMSYEA